MCFNPYRIVVNSLIFNFLPVHAFEKSMPLQVGEAAGLGAQLRLADQKDTDEVLKVGIHSLREGDPVT